MVDALLAALQQQIHWDMQEADWKVWLMTVTMTPPIIPQANQTEATILPITPTTPMTNLHNPHKTDPINLAALQHKTLCDMQEANRCIQSATMTMMTMPHTPTEHQPATSLTHPHTYPIRPAPPTDKSIHQPPCSPATEYPQHAGGKVDTPIADNDGTHCSTYKPTWHKHLPQYSHTQPASIKLKIDRRVGASVLELESDWCSRILTEDTLVVVKTDRLLKNSMMITFQIDLSVQFIWVPFCKGGQH